MAIDDGTSVTTKLLTLLNVSATKAGKRTIESKDFVPSEKLNKRKISFSEKVLVKTLHADEIINVPTSTKETTTTTEDDAMVVEDDAEGDVEGVWCLQRT